MKITIDAEVKSSHMNEDEIKDNIYGIVSDFLAQTESIGVSIRIQEISYPAE